MSSTVSAGPGAGRARAAIPGRTQRTDRWWAQPAVTASVLVAFVVYATYAAFQNANYYWAPYISPLYSPCLATSCAAARAGSHTVEVPHLSIFGSWWPLSPAIIILLVPLGFRLTCYYYRRSYYRSIWACPLACAVVEPHKRYRGESRLPLVLQNVHRAFFYLGLVLNAILTYDAVLAFRNHAGQWGHAGLGTVVLLLNAAFLWAYSLSCHSCRHVLGGRLRNFSRHPVRYWLWEMASKLNARHMQIAWTSLVFVALTDAYVRLVASGTITDPHLF